ncbi:MAG: radical SAM protein [Candidatus Omnitrophota bacterium]
MNVLFVYSAHEIFSPERPLQTPKETHFGISCISALLKAHGHSTKLVVLSRLFGRKNRTRLDDAIKTFSPEVICFTSVSSEYPFIAKMADYAKERYPGIFLVIGGAHASLNPDEVIRDNFDALCVGEGEHPVLELVSQLEKGMAPASIPNLWIKRGNAVEKNAPRPFQDLDELPFADREIWRGLIEDERVQESVAMGRGCPFECTYCSNHAFRKLAKGTYVRFRSPDNIAAEIKSIIAAYPEKRDFYLEVETVGVNKAWALELASRLEELNRTLKEPLSFGVNLRITPNMELDDLFTAFRRSNFKFLNIGLESGSERVRRDILKRHYSNDDVSKAVSLARKYGFRVNLYNLVGIPGETPDDFKETVRMNRLCQPDKTATSIFYPYPGTELYSVCRERGLLRETKNALERCEATLDLPEFPKRDIQRSFIWFDYNVYKGHKPLSKILSKVLVDKLRSNSHLHYLYRKLTYSGLLRRLKDAMRRRIQIK